MSQASKLNVIYHAIRSIHPPKTFPALAVLLKLATFVMLCCLYGYGQAPNNYTPFENHGVYSIDLQNLSVMLNIPVRQKSGAMKFSASEAASLGFFTYDASNGVISDVSKMNGSLIGLNGLAGKTSVVKAGWSATVSCPDNSLTTRPLLLS